jgi:hypothetical protein
MDVRKVQNIVKEIYAGGSIKVSITEDLEQLTNRDKVLVIGSTKTIKYTFQTSSELMMNYFKIIDEFNFQIIELIDKYIIQKQQFFPIYGFSRINGSLRIATHLKQQQKDKLDEFKRTVHHSCKAQHSTIVDIENDNRISQSNKINAIIYSVLESRVSMDLIKEYLIDFPDKNTTNYRRLLCAYDYIKYNDSSSDFQEENAS